MMRIKELEMAGYMDRWLQLPKVRETAIYIKEGDFESVS